MKEREGYSIGKVINLENGGKITICVPHKERTKEAEQQFDRFIAKLIIRDAVRSRKKDRR